ncbi:hypothetical protein [Plantactinospora endophytica]
MATTTALDLTSDILEAGGRDGPAMVARAIAHLLRLVLICMPGDRDGR